MVCLIAPPTGVLVMKLPEHLAEAVGQVAINTVIESGLVSVGDAEGQAVPGNCVWVWTGKRPSRLGKRFWNALR